MADRLIKADMLIAEVLRRYPSTGRVFKKYFGDGCVTCPGSASEDIAFGSAMHNVNADDVLRDLETAAMGARKRTSSRGTGEKGRG
jgi:hybrid cluster-associated redox disulfide protein